MKAAYIYSAPARPATPGTPSQVCTGLGVRLLKPHPAPYGLVTTIGNATQSPRGLGGGLDKLEGFAPQGRAANGVAASQPLQWSSEFTDTDLALVYYNYRHYNPLAGRWCGRDLARTSEAQSLYCYIWNTPVANYDISGLIIDTVWDVGNVIWDVGNVIYGAATGDDNKVQEGVTDLALDVLAALVPGVPAGVSKVSRAAAKNAAKGTAKKGSKLKKACLHVLHQEE